MRYLITWVTYGTHLPGDPRGTVDATHNTPNTRLADPKARRHELAQASLTAPPYLLSSEARPVAIEALKQVCQHRNWTLIAAHARTNHIHAIVESESRPEQILNDFKAYATRALNEIEPRQTRWARHGSTRWLWKDQDVKDATQYVIEEQGEPMATHQRSTEPRA